MGFYLIKKILHRFKLGLKKKIRAELNNKGFSLISTLVASVIGLIVIFGLNKSLVHLNTQSMQLQSQIKQQNLYKRVGEFFSDSTRCTAHFNGHYSNQVKNPAAFSFQELKGSNINLSNSDFLKSHGLEPPDSTKHYNYFETTCNSASPKNCKVKMYLQNANEIKVQFFEVDITATAPHTCL